MQQFSPENFHSIFDEVSTMNLAFGNSFGNNTPQRVQKQCANINDEFKELQVAIANGNLIEIRDAMCDILVFSLGAFHLMGRDFDERYGYQGVPVVNYPAEEMCDKLQLHTLRFPYLLKNLEHHLETTLVLDSDTTPIEKALWEIITWAMQIADLTGYPAMKDMHAVYVSNMSKFCANDADLTFTVEKYGKLQVEVYAEGEYPTKCVKSFKDQKDINGENYPKGKFLKGVKYQAPVFE